MKLSIVTITFNDLKGLAVTRQSICKQTFCDYEWIVVDGGSTDGTKEFLEEHNKEIAWWCSEPDQGVYSAQNKGTCHAKGEYCIYMNSGDTFHSCDVLEKLFKEETCADVIYGNWVFVYADGKTWKLSAPRIVDMAFFFDSNICHQAMLIKTELLLRRPYDESMKIYGDWDEWIELYMQGAKFEYRDVIVCDFLFGGLSTDESSKTLKNKRKAEIELLHKRYYAEPWQSTMARVVPILHEYKALKSWQDEGGMTSNERKLFSEKRKKHNKIIRVLIYVCCLLLTANIATILYILYR